LEKLAMESSARVQMSASGLIEIPTEIREKLHWDDAMELDIRLTASGFMVESAPPRKKGLRLEDLRGLLRHVGERVPDESLQRPVDLAEEP